MAPTHDAGGTARRTRTGKGSDELASSLAGFEAAHPEYRETAHVDELRALEYSRLDSLGITYLDFTGGSLYAASQVREHQALLEAAVLGNPHSGNLASRATTDMVERTRSEVLGFFRASPDEYEVVFTPNATGALRLVGEAYPFCPGSTYLMTFDNHNSVNGIREFARAKGAAVRYVPLTPDEMRVGPESLDSELARPARDRPGLFAYPAQSNFSGVLHPLEWVDVAKRAGWDVLLDAAAFVPTNDLDLSRWHPDFVPVSFYKLFGYPTGIGALLARHEALARLVRPWYAGGNLTFSSVSAAEGEAHGFYRTPGTAGFEDGTVDSLGIPAVGIGLRHVGRVGIGTIHSRVTSLAGWLLDELASLRHGNGAPLVHVYGPAGTDRRGATIAMNVFDPTGELVDSTVVEHRANFEGIALRAGCHCNPGAREVALGLTGDVLTEAFRGSDQMSYEQFLHVIDGKTTGACRASLGIASDFADVHRFAAFVRTFRDRPRASLSGGTS